MTLAKKIGPKKRHHYNASPFGFRNQKLPKYTLYQINSGQKPKKQKKNLKSFEKRGKNQRISIDLGGKRSKVIQYAQQ